MAYAAIGTTLTAYYPLDGNANDNSGNGNHGTPYSGVSFTSGKNGQGALFDGVDDYITLPVSENLTQTIVAWVKPDSSAASTFMTIVDSDRCYYYGQGIEISYPGFTQQNFQVDTHNAFYDTGKSVEWDTWQQVAVVYTEGNVTFYHNNTLVTSVAYTHGGLDGNTFTIGSHCSTEGSIFKGIIDEVRIYNTALSSSEIQQIYSDTNTNTSDTSTTNTQDYNFSYSYSDPYESGADDYIVNVSNAILYTEGTVRAWKQDIGSNSFESATPGVITYHFDFEKLVSEAQLFISTSTFYWSYSQGHSFIYGSLDGSNWVQLVEAVPPAFGEANTQRVQSLPANLLGGQSLWFKVELYSYGDRAAEGGVWTNTAQHSRHDTTAGNTTFSLEVKFSGNSSLPSDPIPQTGSVCSPDNLDLCQTSESCVFEGIGFWCDESCTSSECTYTPERDQCAEYNAVTGKVNVTCVIVEEDAYTVELSLYSYEPLLFELTGLDTYFSNYVDPDCAEFNLDTSVLYMPCINLEGEGISAGFELTSTSPVLFGVQEVEILGTLSEIVLTDLYVNENSSDPLVASFADINGRYYAIYGIKDSDNIPLYYNRLETYMPNSYGSLDEYLTIEFDSDSRPTVFRLPGEEGEFVIDYFSDTTAKVTVTLGGESESVDAVNPFSGIKSSINANIGTKRSRPYESYHDITYVGDIISCSTETPKATVQRNFESTLQKKYPMLSRSFEAKVSVNTFDDDVDYSYNYKITIPGDDFDAWSRSCKAGYFFNSSLGFIGVWKERAGDLITGVYSLFRDYRAGSSSISKRAVVDKITDTATKGIPIISIARNFNDAWEVEGSGAKGPCGSGAYDFKRRRLLHEQTITIDDGSPLILKKTYQPTASWLYGAGYVQEAPTFDFSDQCDTPDTVSCDRDLVKDMNSRELCREAGGVWFTGGLHYSNLGYCSCW